MSTTDNEHIMDDLHDAQRVAAELARALENDPAVKGSRHAFYARSLVSRLYKLETDLLENS